MYVIVIEDDPVIRQELVCLLENALYRVSALEDFKDPVSFVLTEDPDLVIRENPGLIFVRRSVCLQMCPLYL